jgi:hypothetical protein
MRTLTQGQKDAIGAAVVPPVNLLVCFDGQNKESSDLATQLIGALEQGGATIMREPTPLIRVGLPGFGILSKGVPVAIKTAIAAVFPVMESSSSLGDFPGRYGAGDFFILGMSLEPLALAPRLTPVRRGGAPAGVFRSLTWRGAAPLGRATRAG